jgi:hypothetical protein
MLKAYLKKVDVMVNVEIDPVSPVMTRNILTPFPSVYLGKEVEELSKV